jgi:hypothetical protein
LFSLGTPVSSTNEKTGRNFSMSGINSGRSNQTMWNLCGIVAAILKMATGRNFSMSGINSMWVENDVPTLKNFYRSPFSK